MMIPSLFLWTEAIRNLDTAQSGTLVTQSLMSDQQNEDFTWKELPIPTNATRNSVPQVIMHNIKCISNELFSSKSLSLDYQCDDFTQLSLGICIHP